MAPGYEDIDFVPGDRDELTRKYPQAAALIENLTRD
jgi:hypothetical protein